MLSYFFKKKEFVNLEPSKPNYFIRTGYNMYYQCLDDNDLKVHRREVLHLFYSINTLI